MKYRFSIFAIGLVLGSMAQARTPLSASERQGTLAETTPNPANYSIERKLAGFHNRCRLSELKLSIFNPTLREREVLTLRLFQPPWLPVGAPAVLVFPTIDGNGIMEDSIASSLCGAGINVVQANVIGFREPKEYPSWGAEDKMFKRAILVSRIAIDFLKSEPAIRSSRIGVHGVSLGSIVGSMLIGLENRIDVAVLTMGGADVPGILTTTRLRKLGDVRKKRMRIANINSAEDYYAQLDRTIRMDPLFFKPFVSQENILMMMAKGDQVVDYVYAEKLWQHLGQPQRFVYPTAGHLVTIVGTHLAVSGNVVAWFRNKLFEKP